MHLQHPLPVRHARRSPGSRSTFPVLPVRHTQMARLEYALQAKPDTGLVTQGTLANLGFAALNPGLS